MSHPRLQKRGHRWVCPALRDGAVSGDHDIYPMTNLAVMDQMLRSLTPDEVSAVLRFIAACELVEQMSPEEADAWRGRILAWRRFLELGESARPDA